MAKPRFAVHPGVAMAHKVVANRKHNTGRSLKEWIALVQAKGPSAEKDRALWLKITPRLGHALCTMDCPPVRQQDR
jgi:hypothetical protein